MSYIGVCGEVRTRPFLAAALGQRKRVVVPYCAGGQIGLFWLRDLGELAPGVFGIPEPRAELRLLGERRVEAAELDLIVVLGVAFDRCGGRLGHGKGYYDGLLRHVRPDAAVVALAFECQLVPAVPMLPHDIFMHKIITQRAVYQRRGPQ